MCIIMLYRRHQGLAKCQLPLCEVVMLLKIIIFVMMIIMVIIIIIIVLIILRRIANKHNIISDNSNNNNDGSQQCQMNFLICEKRRLDKHDLRTVPAIVYAHIICAHAMHISRDTYSIFVTLLLACCFKTWICCLPEMTVKESRTASLLETTVKTSVGKFLCISQNANV